MKRWKIFVPLIMSCSINLLCYNYLNIYNTHLHHTSSFYSRQPLTSILDVIHIISRFSDTYYMSDDMFVAHEPNHNCYSLLRVVWHEEIRAQCCHLESIQSCYQDLRHCIRYYNMRPRSCKSRIFQVIVFKHNAINKNKNAVFNFFLYI